MVFMTFAKLLDLSKKVSKKGNEYTIGTFKDKTDSTLNNLFFEDVKIDDSFIGQECKLVVKYNSRYKSLTVTDCSIYRAK